MRYHRRGLLIWLAAILCAEAIAHPWARADVIGVGSGAFGDPPAGVFHFGATHSDIYGGTPFKTGGSVNILSIATQSFSAAVGESFAVSQLLYINGDTTLLSSPADFPLTISVALTQPAVQTLTFNFDLHLTITPNKIDPQTSADILTLPTSFPPISFSSGSQAYLFNLSGFGRDADHILSSATVLESQFKILPLWATVQPTTVTTTPMPGTLAGSIVLLTLLAAGSSAHLCRVAHRRLHRHRKE
jgi:hypothetical protein